jgi:multidrug transporter EmrE-like cation transporter
MNNLGRLQKYNRPFLIVFALISLALFIFAVAKVRAEKENGIWTFMPFILTLLNGTFILGDAIVFSIFFFIVSLVLIYKNDVRYTLLVFLMFWIVRSAGEVVYWLNYQFTSIHPHQPQFPVRNQLEFLTGSIPENSVYTLYQATNQVLLVVFLILLFLLIKNWDKFRNKS